VVRAGARFEKGASTTPLDYSSHTDEVSPEVVDRPAG
jgi:hypothetical protein